MSFATPPTDPGPLTVDLDRTREHLRLLSIFYFVYAGIQALGFCFGLVYTGIGIAIVATGQSQDPDAVVAGWIFFGMGGCVVLLTVVTAWLMYLAGRSLRQHRRRIFIMVMAGVACLNLPMGTVLGVFTFVVMSSDGARQLFEAARARIGVGTDDRYMT